MAKRQIYGSLLIHITIDVFPNGLAIDRDSARWGDGSTTSSDLLGSFHRRLVPGELLWN